ncbi:nitrogen assimilation response regulator NtrX [Meridianimarinicoccus sp. RP-17]|uniref:nitrogen assimilation response regulator NtrX n=1 Tax=Meridianimarinicoccus zhengii TaxID=2056810 RepID=UPI000DAE12AC|nr:sigma-54 dependent transcriptional regulator [Phycocomes zhengii]
MTDILIVDDERDIRELISDILEDEGFTTRLAGGSEECMGALADQRPRLMILDIWLKDSAMDGIDILKTVKRDMPEIPVVIISGHGNIEIAVAAIKQGAYDFIEKPFNIDQLLVVIRRAMETARLRRENSELRRQDVGPGELIGSSAAFRLLKGQVDKVARTNSRVMLMGPPGAGKEAVARYLHARSARAGAGFVTFNCGAVSPERMEQVLFGRETAGQPVEPGLLEQADKGTLYLDEVADLPPDTQARLLRVLVEQQFTRVGGAARVKVDLRIVSSTARDLDVEIDAGRFRQELFHRLAVVPVEVPGLDDRRADIPEIARHLIGQFHETEGLPLRELGEEAAATLQSMPWPGNIRQLRNVIERVLILGPDTGEIAARELPATGHGGSDEDEDRVVLSPAIARLPLREARELFEREYLLTQINRFGGNISRTASFVGMERSALHRKLKSLNVVTATRAGGRVATFEDRIGEDPVGEDSDGDD